MEPANYLWVGLGGMLLAALSYWGFRRSSKRLETILETPTIACRDLPGLGASTVEVTGIARVAEPLVSDLTRAACVAFTCSVTEHWTTTETVRDAKGNTQTVTRYHTAVRYTNSQRIPFQVIDDSGPATVEPEGADIDLIGQNAGPPPPDSPAFGIAPLHWNGHLTYSESVLPIETKVYVMAEVSERNTLIKPTTLQDPFIISYHSEAELIHSARVGTWAFGILAIVALLAGGAALGYWFDLGMPRPWQ